MAIFTVVERVTDKIRVKTGLPAPLFTYDNSMNINDHSSYRMNGELNDP